MTDDELRDLIERSSQVEEMTQHPGWALLIDYVRAQMEGKQRWLLLGHADSFDDYRRVAGWLQGVTDVFDAPKALAEQLAREKQKEQDA